MANSKIFQNFEILKKNEMDIFEKKEISLSAVVWYMPHIYDYKWRGSLGISIILKVDFYTKV